MKQTLKYIYHQLFETMKFAETKHSITITIATAIVAFATTFFSDNVTVNLLSSACIMFALISIIYSFVALTLRRNVVPKRNKIKSKINLLDYHVITSFDEYSYVQTIKEMYKLPNAYKPDDFDFDLARQVIITARAIKVKLGCFNYSLVFLLFSLICGILVASLKGNLF